MSQNAMEIYTTMETCVAVTSSTGHGTLYNYGIQVAVMSSTGHRTLYNYGIQVAVMSQHAMDIYTTIEIHVAVMSSTCHGHLLFSDIHWNFIVFHANMSSHHSTLQTRR